jgi:hypothetical protein
MAAILVCPARALPSAVRTCTALDNSGTEGTGPNLLIQGVKANSYGTPLDAFNDLSQRVPNGRGLVFEIGPSGPLQPSTAFANCHGVRVAMAPTGTLPLQH